MGFCRSDVSGDNGGVPGRCEGRVESPIFDEPTRALSAPPPAGGTLAAGELLASRYRIRRFIAKGGMGEVYEALDLELEVPVALKTVRRDVAAGPETLRLFKREALLGRSVTHPNVCRIYDVGRHVDPGRNLTFLTMELLEGETLRQRISRGPLDPGRALPLVRQLAEGLEAAHEAGIVHRDFKSANVLIVSGSSGDRAVVTDFGIALARGGVGADASGIGSEVILGTPSYMAPEQVKGESVGPAADLYALGVVMYEMVTGRLPFEGENPMAVARARLEREPPSPRRLVPELDRRWEETILRLLSREPGERFGRALEVVAALTGEAIGAPAAEPRRGALPAERGGFVGRADELEDLGRRFTGGSRLVTLVGPPGIGKTRLAMRFASGARERFPGGVWFCDLTEARSRDGIAAAVARALDVPLSKGDPLVQLGHAIAGRRRCLVILDNFEQVVEEAPLTVGRWIERATEASFLVTSRERLGLGAEEMLSTGPLAEEEGVKLFLQRARELRPGFNPDDKSAEAVRQAVRLLDGLPLAIELAASRVRVMAPAQVLARMTDLFRLLGRGTKGGRHTTLRLAIDGSWELLAPWEQSAFMQLAVFVGGFTLEVAEAVVDLGSFPQAPWVVDVVQALVDKSLLRMWVPERAAEPRFGMYASLEEYARARLRDHDADTERRAEERHGRFYARFGEDEAIEALDGHEGHERRWALGRELENLLGACRRAVARGDGEVAAATYQAAWEILDLRGPYAAALDLGQDVLGMPILTSAARARVLRSAAWARFGVGRIGEARELLNRALALHREAGDRRSEGIVLANLGSLHREEGRVTEAEEHLLRALAIHREVANSRREGMVLINLGLLCLEQGRMSESREHSARALAILREAGDRRHESLVLGNLGVLHCDQGQMEEGRRYYEQALAIHREGGDRGSEGFTISNLGSLEVAEGRVEAGQTHFEHALAVHREVGDRFGEGVVLLNLGILHSDLGRMKEAREDLVRALAIHRELGKRRFEGVSLSYLGRLEARSSHPDEARSAFAAAERLLREVGDRVELGKLLCHRGEAECRSGNLELARASLAEAESLAAATAAGPASELGRAIAGLRRTVPGRPR